MNCFNRSIPRIIVNLNSYKNIINNDLLNLENFISKYNILYINYNFYYKKSKEIARWKQ